MSENVTPFHRRRGDPLKGTPFSFLDRQSGDPGNIIREERVLIQKPRTRGTRKEMVKRNLVLRIQSAGPDEGEQAEHQIC